MSAETQRPTTAAGRDAKREAGGDAGRGRKSATPAGGAPRRSFFPGLSPALLVVTLVAVGLRLAAALLFAGSPLIQTPVLEDSSYHDRVLDIHRGAFAGGGLPRASLLYPYLVNVVPWAGGGDARALAAGQALLEGITVLLLMLWLQRRWGRRCALIAGLVYAFDPMGGFFAARLIPVVPATFLFVLFLVLWDQEAPGSRSSTGGTAAGASSTAPSLPAFPAPPAPSAPGLPLGLSAVLAVGFLLQPLPFLTLGIVRAVVSLRGPSPAVGRWRRLTTALLPLLVLGAVAGIIVVAHAHEPDGGPVLAWGGGPAFFRAFSSASGGTPRNFHAPSWQDDPSLLTDAWEGLAREGTRYDIFRFYATRGFQQALENPFGTLGVVLIKAAATVGAFPVPDSLSATFLAERWARPFAYLLVSFALLLGAAVPGALRRRDDPTGRVLVLGLLAVGISCLAGMASAAQRQPALPLLAALAAGWLGTLFAPASASEASAGPEGIPRSRALALAAGGVALSLIAGWLSPSWQLHNPSEDLRLQAESLGRTQDLRQAEPMLSQAIQADPRNLPARVDLSVAYQKDGLIDSAVEQLRTALQTDSTDAGAVFRLSELEQARGNLDEALRLMLRLVPLHPNNPLYLNNLAEMMIRKGEIPSAQALLTRALRLKPDYTVAQSNLETIESVMQRQELMLMPTQMRLAPDDPLSDLISDQIPAAMDAEKWPLADSLLKVAEQKRPEIVQPHWLRAAWYARQGKLPEAVSTLEQCVRLAPGRPMLVTQLAGLYSQAGQSQKIEPLIRDALAACRGDSVRTQALLDLEKGSPAK